MSKAHGTCLLALLANARWWVRSADLMTATYWSLQWATSGRVDRVSIWLSGVSAPFSLPCKRTDPVLIDLARRSLYSAPFDALHVQ